MAHAQGQYSIPSLKDLSFQVFYEKVVSKVDYKTSETVWAYVENHSQGGNITMDIMEPGKGIREACIEKFNHSCRHQQNEDLIPVIPIPDVNIFADCMLDGYFTSLEICLTRPSFYSLSSLMSIIAYRASKLKNLHIHFIGDCDFQYQTSQTCSGFNSLLLPCLEKLALTNCGERWDEGDHNPEETDQTSQWDDDEEDHNPEQTGQTSQWDEGDHNPEQTAQTPTNCSQSLLGTIVKCCPALITLAVKGFCSMELPLLKLILGEVSTILFLNAADDEFFLRNGSVLQGLVVPYKFLNPLILTIQELYLDDNSFSALSDTGSEQHSFHRSAIAFLLRHFPKLRTLDAGQNSSAYITEAISNLHGMPGFDHDGAHKELASPSTCSVSELYVVVRSSAHTIRTAGEIVQFCPRLQRVRFINDRDSPYQPSQSLSPQELESLLREWPQLDAIFVSYLELPFIRPILNVFGPNLTSLHLNFDEDRRNKLDMAWLGGSCTQLKKLSLISLQHPPITMGTEHDPVGWSPDTFLPLLTEFRSNICLGKWAPLFERKSTLTLLQLLCCHVGSRVHPFPVEWDQVPDLWPLLERLEFYRCTGLTISKVEELLPRMANLKKLRLPEQMLENDARLIRIQGIDIAGLHGPSPYYYPCLF